MIRDYVAAMKRRRLSDNTIRLRLFYLRKFAQFHGELSTATLADLERFLDNHGDWSENTQQTVIASIRTFYNWGCRAGHIASNPAENLLPIRVHRRPSRIATDAQIREGLAGGTSVEQAMILLGAECGLRVSEIANLRRSCREGPWLRITGKGGVARSVYMSPELEALLDKIETTSMRHGNYFPGRYGDAMHASTVWRHIRTVVGVNPHALRHRAGTTVYRNTGRDLRVTQEFLGHANPNTTAIYVHVERDDLRRASDASRVA